MTDGSTKRTRIVVARFYREPAAGEFETRHGEPDIHKRHGTSSVDGRWWPAATVKGYSMTVVSGSYFLKTRRPPNANVKEM